MGLILAPVAADKAVAWKAWAEELSGPRKAEFDDFNQRYGLTKHEAWWCETPMGYVVAAIHEGPGADSVLGKVATSTHPFDEWFRGKLMEVHGMDPSKPPPGPMPVRGSASEFVVDDGHA